MNDYYPNNILSQSFYNIDTLTAAKALIGKLLLKKNNEVWSGGMIVETEAYLGKGDPACHAARGKTPRNAPMFGPVGQSYVYFIYGMYYCFNITAFDTNKQNAGAVLIRALEPVLDISGMKIRRNKQILRELTNGPGKLCQALGIDKSFNGKSLQQGDILAAESFLPPSGDGFIVSDTRIGIKEGADYPFRFYLRNNPYVSGKVRKTTL